VAVRAKPDKFVRTKPEKLIRRLCKSADSVNLAGGSGEDTALQACNRSAPLLDG
jgi:hypothetical protein